MKVDKETQKFFDKQLKKVRSDSDSDFNDVVSYICGCSSTEIVALLTIYLCMNLPADKVTRLQRSIERSYYGN